MLVSCAIVWFLGLTFWAAGGAAVVLGERHRRRWKAAEDRALETERKLARVYGRLAEAVDRRLGAVAPLVLPDGEGGGGDRA